MVRGWSDTGKSTLKNLAIAGAMRQGILPIIFETEGNFDFQYAKDCGMDIEPVYEDVEYTDENNTKVKENLERLVTNTKDFVLLDYFFPKECLNFNKLVKYHKVPIYQNGCFYDRYK